MRILAFDTGIKNFAWALAEDDKIINSGMFKNTVKELSSINLSTKQFRKEFLNLCNNSGLKSGDVIVAERFQVRLFNPGAQIEAVGFMLGLIAAYSKVPVYLITASTWKNHFINKYTNIKDANKKIRKFNKGKAKKLQKKLLKFEMEDLLAGSEYEKYEHICDAIGISQWYYEKETGKDSKFIKKHMKGNK